jgi:uncharacterized DUF497 family protein
MPWYFFVWTHRALEKIAEHDVTTEEVEEVISAPDETGFSRSTGRPYARGWTSTGRLLFCVYEQHADDTIEPITAYELEVEEEE